MKNFILLLLITSFTYAQSTLSGSVVDKETNLPLADANVILYGGDELDNIGGTSTDANGQFSFENVQMEGDLKILVKVIGYTDDTRMVTLDNQSNLSLKFELIQTSVALKGVEVYSSLRKVNEGDLANSAIIFNDELKNRQGQHFSDLIQKVPNLNYAGNGTSRPRYFQIRGEGSTSRYADQGPPSTYVGLVLDGMDLSELGMITPLFDMQQVEVLMGVQTSLFGAAASSGLINFKTNDPTDKEEGYVITQLGSYNSFTNGIVYNTPLSNGWSLRPVGHSHLSDGYKDNVILKGNRSASKDEKSFN